MQRGYWMEGAGAMNKEEVVKMLERDRYLASVERGLNNLVNGQKFKSPDKLSIAEERLYEVMDERDQIARCIENLLLNKLL